MALKLNDTYVKDFIGNDEYTAIAPAISNAYKQVKEKSGLGNDFLGWFDLPETYDKDEFERIKKAADRIKNMCDVLIVIGIGGSYIGAKAAIDFLRSPNYNLVKKDTPDIYFAGNHMSSSEIAELIEICKDKDICLNIISKSGTTTEPAIATRIFKAIVEEKYGEGAKDRIFVTTDAKRGKLKEMADTMGYETFVILDDIGGRFSVLTAVGLLPIAVSGADIDKLMLGAQKAKREYTSDKIEENPCCKYAAIRNLLNRRGKVTEILASYEPYMASFAEWWKQLYGESEGKDEKGIWPASAIFSTDLHSLGQFIQNGTRNLMETIIDVKESRDEVVIPYDEKNADELNFLANKTLHEVNRTAYLATIYSHIDGGVANTVIEVDKRDEENFGYLVYFFELACAISGYTLGVNPFNQPGVEGYKKNMYALLDKPGEENKARKEILLKRMK